MKLVDAALALGMKEREIAHVADSAIGWCVTTTDGTVMVNLPADQPDAAGRSGWMLLEKPVEDAIYSCHVFVPHVYQLQEPVPWEGYNPDDNDEIPGLLAEAIAASKGNMENILGWAGEDIDMRARYAQQAEMERAKPRKAVLKYLEPYLDEG